MTDQILKRLAEIEGYISVRVPTGKMAGGMSMDVNTPPNAKPIMRLKVWKEDGSEFNPLTNPADTMALIEKYQVSLLHKYYGPERSFWLVGVEQSVGKHESLSMAVCLAVIEANGGKSLDT